MSIKLTKRIAGELLKRGEGAVRIRQGSLDDAKKAITRDDVRRMIKEGAIFALKERSDVYKKPQAQKRKRGAGKRKGTRKARQGRIWKKKARSQRLLLKKLKEMKKIDRNTFKKYYLLVKGNAFPDKRSLLLHLSDEGIEVTEDELKRINDYVKGLYK